MSGNCKRRKLALDDTRGKAPGQCSLGTIPLGALLSILAMLGVVGIARMRQVSHDLRQAIYRVFRCPCLDIFSQISVRVSVERPEHLQGIKRMLSQPDLNSTASGAQYLDVSINHPDKHVTLDGLVSTPLRSLTLVNCNRKLLGELKRVGYWLQELTLIGYTRVFDCMYQIIPYVPHLTKFVAVEFSNMPHNFVGKLSALRHLQEVRLLSARLDAEGLRMLGKCKNLLSLMLNDCRITQIERWVEYLHGGLNLHSFGMMYETNLTTADLHALLRCQPSLEKLDLTGTKVAPGQVLTFGCMLKLHDLSVKACPWVTNAFLQQIAQNSLSTLDISYCSKVTDDGLMHLSTMKTLTCLNLTGCTNITSKGLSRFGQRQPSVQTAV